MPGGRTRLLQRRLRDDWQAARDEDPPHAIVNSRPVRALSATAQGTVDWGKAPTQWINRHLAFGDAQTVAMLNLARSPDKTRRPLHRTEMSS